MPNGGVHEDQKWPYVVILCLNRSVHVQDISWQLHGFPTYYLIYHHVHMGNLGETHNSANKVTDNPNNLDTVVAIIEN